MKIVRENYYSSDDQIFSDTNDEEIDVPYSIRRPQGRSSPIIAISFMFSTQEISSNYPDGSLLSYEDEINYSDAMISDNTDDDDDDDEDDDEGY